MNKPLLQAALDHTALSEALESARILAPELDVLEAGTILCYAEGVRAVESLASAYPKHIVLADLKAADAGGVAAAQVFERGADWMTVICCAAPATMEAALKTAREYGGDIQVELYGDWSFDHAAVWRSIGIAQVVYHRGRDDAAAGRSWCDEDLDKIRRLAEMGFEVSVTGGLSPDDPAFFRGMPVKAFIAGRSLYGAADPLQAARAFRRSIDEFFG